MNKTAYLVAFIDTKIKPPIVQDIGIFSEPSPTCSLRFRPVLLHEVTGTNYEDAEKRLSQIIKTNPEFQWCEAFRTPRWGAFDAETNEWLSTEQP